MRLFAAVLFLTLVFIPTLHAIERFELENEISLIITRPSSRNYILSLANKNNFNVTLVDNINAHFPFDIDPSKVSAVDNYNQTVIPDKIEKRSITLTYSNTIPPGGYGKIFLDLNKTKPEPPKTVKPMETQTPTSPPVPVIESPPMETFREITNQPPQKNETTLDVNITPDQIYVEELSDGFELNLDLIHVFLILVISLALLLWRLRF